MDHEIPTSAIPEGGNIGARRSRVERLQHEKAMIERRLAAANEKRLAVERELRRAEAQARRAARNADAREKFLIGAAFLSLLAQGNAPAREMMMTITQHADKRDRDRVWRALQLRVHPSAGSESSETMQESDRGEVIMSRS